MAKNLADETTSNSANDSQPSAQIPWFVGGVLLSLLLLCTVALLAMFLVSAAANAYLTWEMSGMEVEVKVPPPADESQTERASSSNGPIVVVAAATEAPPIAALPEATSPSQQALLPASSSTPFAVIVATPQTVGTASQVEANAPTAPSGDSVAIAPTQEAAAPPPTPTKMPTPTSFPPTPTPLVSTNTYELIPLEGERESRAAPEHADLSLDLRQPEPSDVKKTLVDLAGATDSQAPNLLELFEPNIVGAYAIHEWNWDANRPGAVQDGGVLIEVATTPGEPIYIPKKNQDIYQGKYYATLLYATEDSLTFVYLRQGNVAGGYSVQYQGLQVDPNLLKLYRESSGSQLPGLTLDTPVGIATDKLLVAMRDRGRYMDTRSRKDWWK